MLAWIPNNGRYRFLPSDSGSNSLRSRARDGPTRRLGRGGRMGSRSRQVAPTVEKTPLHVQFNSSYNINIPVCFLHNVIVITGSPVL